jgi:hypothetical protein
MSQYLVYDRNRKALLGVYPANQDALDAIRNFKSKVEGKHTAKLVLEVLTASDPDVSLAQSDTNK